MTLSKSRFLAVLNALVLALVIYWNYYANAQGINENSVGSLSDQYDSLFTPAGYAFSIWGLIYVALIINAIYQISCAFGYRDSTFLEKAGPFLIIANLANGLWIWLWLTERTGASVIAMLVILISLIIVLLKLRIGNSKVTKSQKKWIWWPISLYIGWITVAMVANISAYLAKIQWQSGPNEQYWAISMMVTATLIYGFVLLKRGMITFSLVGAWALMAIAIRHWNVQANLQWTAYSCTIVLILLAFRTFRITLKSH